MDGTVVAAIVGALTAGTTDGITDAAKEALSDGYHKLRTTLVKKFGPSSEVASALEKVEARPESEGRRTVLEEELKASASDPEILSQASLLLELLRTLPNGSTGGQVAHGTGIAQADRNSSATVTLTSDPK